MKNPRHLSFAKTLCAVTFGTVAMMSAQCGGPMGNADGLGGDADNLMDGMVVVQDDEPNVPMDIPPGVDVPNRVRDVPSARVDVPNARVDVPTGLLDVPSAPGNGDDPATRTSAQMCARWRTDRAPGPNSEWTGNAAACELGTIQPGTQEAALRILNLYRWLVGVGPTTIDPSQITNQQPCAVMMTANNMLSHMPPNNWRCYQAAGAMGAGSSNLSLGVGAFGSIELYINERDQNLGHRRWCLFSQLGPTFFGTTGRASCMQVFQRTARAQPAFVAYPNRGFAPIETFQSGVWHVQQAGAPFGGGPAAVTVQEMPSGRMLAVTPVNLAGGYGGGNAQAFSPSGWMPVVGTTYQVTVMPAGSPMIQYTTTPVRCP